MIDTDTKLSKVLDLLIQQTRSGKLLWREGYRDSFQASLAKQTIVVSNVLSMPVLEIRDSRGDLVQQVGVNPLTDSAVSAAMTGQQRSKVATDPKLENKVRQLFNLLNDKDKSTLNAALDNLLEELEE